jgi:hypothetical protein
VGVISAKQLQARKNCGHVKSGWLWKTNRQLGEYLLPFLSPFARGMPEVRMR